MKLWTRGFVLASVDGVLRCRAPFGWARPVPSCFLCTPAPPCWADRTVARLCMKPHWRDKSMKRILVVEDVEFNRDLVVQLLENTYEVLTAVDAVEGAPHAAYEQADYLGICLALPL